MLKPFTFLFRQHGVSMIEVLITIVILAFGLLGLAGLQGKTQLIEMESYQRAQALSLMADMAGRINANRTKADEYVPGIATTYGTGDTSQPASCAGIAALSARDVCEWSKKLQGEGEKKDGVQVGGASGARGCITLIQSSDPTPGVCRPGIYQVTVAWQGLHNTVAPALDCGKDAYGSDTYRRVVSTEVSVGIMSCQ